MKIDLTKMVENKLNDCLIESLENFTKKDYGNPLFDLYKSVVESNCEELKSVIKQVLYNVSTDGEFKAMLREQAYKSLTRSIISFNQGVLDKELNILKQDELFKAKMKVLISEALRDQ